MRAEDAASATLHTCLSHRAAGQLVGPGRLSLWPWSVSQDEAMQDPPGKVSCACKASLVTLSFAVYSRTQLAGGLSLCGVPLCLLSGVLQARPVSGHLRVHVCAPDTHSPGAGQGMCEKLARCRDPAESRPLVHRQCASCGSQASLSRAGSDVKDAKVISISTGTKCINGEYMSDRGLALNDCHAEIISRRSLLRFLYTQLELYLK